MRAVLSLAALVVVGACCVPEQAPETLPDRSPPAGSWAYGTFEGRVPRLDIEGQKIKLGLGLFVSEADGSPTGFHMERIEVGDDSPRVVYDGKWTRTIGIPGDPDAVVIQLDSHGPPDFNRFLAVGKDILLVLNEDLTPRVGNASWSYTLSRTR